jgi:predicted component of type VI protein secretion system
MPRPKSTKTVDNPSQAIAEAINEPVNLDFDEIAQKLGIDEPELRDRLEGKLNDPSVHRWELIPAEHESLIEQIDRDLEAEKSVRRLEAASEPPIPQIQVQEEPPILQEEPQPEKKKRSKRQSTALTNKKAEAIQDNRQNAAQAHSGVAETLAILSAQEGAQDGANAATAYLHGLVSNMTNIKGEGATVIAAEMLQRTANKRGFNPDEVLQKIGVPLSSQTRETLNDVMGQVLGKAQAATEEMTDTAWGNGYNVQDELTRLKNLMNLND